MLKVPNSIPVKSRLSLSAWAVAALLSLMSLASSLLHLSPVDQSLNARAEQTNLPSDHTARCVQEYDSCNRLDCNLPLRCEADAEIGEPIACLKTATRGRIVRAI
jgi:hypothetical protein